MRKELNSIVYNLDQLYIVIFGFERAFECFGKRPQLEIGDNSLSL